MGNYNTTISKRARNANNIIISTLSSTTSKTTIDNNNDNYEFINDPSLNDYDNSHYNSDNNNIISNVNNMKTSLINSAKIKLQDTLNDIATTATNLNNNQNINYNSDNNNNNNELIFDSSDIDTTINDSIYMKPITTTITTIIDTHHNNLVGGNSGLLQKLGRGLSSNEVNMIRNHVTSHGSNGNTFTSPHNTNALLNDYGSNSLNSAMVNIQNHDNLMKQMEYDKFMNEIWIGIVLTLIVISLVFCICSCFLYHQFRQWKRNYRQNCQRNYDIESVKLNVEDDDPVPNYTLVSGLPSYEAALELLRNSTSTTTSPSSLSTTRLLPLSSGSNCIHHLSDTTAATATTLLPAPPYTPPIIGTQSTSPPSIFHVFGTINNDNQNINSNSNSNMNSNNNNNDNTNNLKELSNSCEKIVIPIIHRSSENQHQQQHQQQQQQQLQCQQQDDTNTTEIINYEDYQTSEKNFIKSNVNNINLSDELNSDTKTHH